MPRTPALAPPPARPPSNAAAWPRTARAAAGFTLVELMVVLAVAVVALAMAGPPMASFAAANRVSAVKSSLAGSVALARVEAARRGVPVLLVAAAGGSTGQALAGGWEVVVDANGDGAAQSGESRLRRQAAPGRGVRVDGPASIAFSATGSLVGGLEAIYTVCADGTAAARSQRLVVAPSGVVEVLPATAADCPAS